MYHLVHIKRNKMKLLTKTATALTLALSLTLSATAGESLIPYTSVKDAKGEVKKIYDEVKGAFGIVPAPIQQHSVNPALLKNLWDMFKAESNPNFSQKLTAIMRMSVANAPKLECDYCIGFNEGMLMNMFKMELKEIQAIKKDPNNAKLEPKDKKMLMFMVDSTTKPKEIDKARIDELKKLGWSDKDIFDGLKMATQMVAMTLMVDTLKISRDF